MAEAEKAEAEYESDLDDAPLPAARRRAAASDDEEEGDDDEGRGGSSPPPSSTVFDSESDLDDGQGAAESYDGNEGVYSTEEEEEEFEDALEEREAAGGVGGGGGGGGEVQVVAGELAVAPDDEGNYEEEESAADGEEEEVMKGDEEVKKGSEPYAVPTAGAFYEHDTRFQAHEDRGRGHQRQIFGGQKIWNPKEEALWVHDRFNEINFHDDAKRTRFYNATKSFDNVHTQSHSYYGNVKGDNDERNVYREKGTTNYRSDRTTSGISSAQNNSKSYSRSQNAEVSFNAGVGKHTYQPQTLPCNQTFGSNTSSAPLPFHSPRSSHQEFPFFQREKARRVTFSKLFSSAVHKASLQHEQTLPCKQTFGSNISSAPPTFYSSGSSHQGLPFIQREKAQRVAFSKLFSSAVHKAHNSLTPQSLPVSRRKAFFPFASVEHGTAVDSHCIPVDVMPWSGFHPMSTSHNYSKDSKFWDQGRDLNIAETTRPCTEPQIAVCQQRSVQPSILPAPRASARIFSQKDTSTNKIQSHPQTTLISSSDDDEATTPHDPNSSVVLSAVTVQDGMKEVERICFLDGASLVVGDTGARSSTLDEPGPTNPPAKLPVMLFSGLYPRGHGFPSVAMVLPGFVGQQCGGNSEMGLMNWLPILTGATGVREGTSSPPNFGSNCPQPSELASSLASPRYHGATNDPISLTSQEMPEAVSHEPVHHRSRTRRYSEMNFTL